MEKYCRNCKNYKKFIDFHKHKKGQFGLYPICKNCRLNTKVLKCDENITNKKCKGCIKNLDINNFYKNINNKDGYQNECKKCYLEKRSKNQSKLKNYLNMLLKKFIKRNSKNFTVSFNENDLLNLYQRQNKKCLITEHEMTHIVDTKGRIDNIYNISILVSKQKDIIKIEDIKLVINLFYSVGIKYKLDSDSILKFYKELTCKKCDFC